jgi:hypothetical protein
MTDELREVNEQEAPEAEVEESTEATTEMGGEATTADTEPTAEDQGDGSGAEEPEEL